MKPFAVIGLGKFGYYLATSLYEKGHEVLAIDIDADLVQSIKDSVSQAVVADATNSEVLKAMGLGNIQDVVVCIGTNLSASILATLNVKELGIPNIHAKAISEPPGRILRKVGATDVFFPEKDRALSLAEMLHVPNMLEYFPFMEGYSISEIAVPKEIVGKRLRDIDLINRYGIQVVAIKEIVPNRMHMVPTGDFLLKDSDILVLLGQSDALEKFSNQSH